MPRAIYLVVGMVLGAIGASTALVAPARAFAQDPVKLLPERFTILLENDRVRVAEYTSHPGDKQAMHSHPDGVVYYLTASKAKQIYPDGTAMETTHKAGDAVWRAAVTHATENIGGTDTHYIAIELKECKEK